MLVTEKSTPGFAKNESGGKGFKLYEMSRVGLPVPAWVVVGRQYFQSHLKTNNLEIQLEQLLSLYSKGEATALETSHNVANLIETAPVSSDLASSVRQALQKFGDISLFSVRSSAADEDSAAHSFAGQLSSFLYVQGYEDIILYIKKCWASAFTERALVYRKENGIDLGKISVAVVIQQMIDPEKSGVLFTCDPIENSADKFVISSVYGVGEGLVSGALDADSFWLSSENGDLIKSEIIEKDQAMSKDSSGHCKLIPVPTEKRSLASLNPDELKRLFDFGKTLHNLWSRAQDIEWAIYKDQIYILQSRPVTSLAQDLQAYPNLWDNSNIVESYGGKTLPLSFTFALRNYKAVYVQFCEVLGVPNEIIKDMDSYLSYMLGSIRGRVYYNLFNWYKLVGVLPGFQQNREFMETMMGVSEALSGEIAERIKPHPSWETPSGKFRKFITGLNFLKYHFTIQSIVDDFLKTFHRDFEKYRSMPLAKMRGDQLIQIYMEVERNMLGRWKAPIINDFLCMVHFGILKKLTSRWMSDVDQTIQNDLLAGEGGLESAEPTRQLLHLASEVAKSPALTELINTTPPERALEALNQSEFKEFYAMVQSYLNKFGFRCMSEMKLEEIDLMTDPSYLFVNLKNYLRSGQTTPHDDSGEKKLRQEAEKRAKAHLSWVKRVLYFWVLKHARKAVKNRENTRFARTRIYGIARTIFQNIGEDLASLNALNHPRDIFWLTIEEVFGIYNGALPCESLNDIIAIRKRDYETYEEEPASRIMTRGAVYWRNNFFPEQHNPFEIQEGEDCDLKGLPCCPGILEGVVKVILNPGDNLDLNGEILVTARTDPGWVPLYPSISGLLVERGSLLSHSAIVAREMGKPAIVSIPNLTKTLKTGMRIRMDGKAGTIKILS